MLPHTRKDEDIIEVVERIDRRVLEDEKLFHEIIKSADRFGTKRIASQLRRERLNSRR
ncbi:MAG TPA: hypothetical protein VJ046_00050 [Candidatus Paceibacterota bacterium]|nr:hypothetical protein [Candidatus Paceibacterota bacterium]